MEVVTTKRKLVNDLTGQRFGRLMVLGVNDKPSRKTYFICQCDCGNVKSVRADALMSGATKSCGCLKAEQDKRNLNQTKCKKKFAEFGAKVGGTRLYSIWQGMESRCYNVNDARYHRYGGRGIIVCPEWKENYIAFHEWAVNNGYVESKTIDRVNNDGNYEPGNCRWATIKEQCNNRSTNIKITVGNSTRTLTEWCEIFDLDAKVVFARYSRAENITLDELFRAIPR